MGDSVTLRPLGATAPNDRLATSLKIHVLETSDKARAIVCATARVGAGEPIDEPASPRIFLEIDIGERDAVRVLDGEGLAALADAKPQGVGRGHHFTAD
jgi:hypothetical protein